MAVRPFDEIFRDFVTDGIPTSGPHHPYKPDIRDSLNAIVRGAFPDNRVIKLNNANEGTANEIVVSASVDIPTAVYQVLYVLNVTQENTGPVTVSGAINRKLVTNTSEPIPAGYLKPGMAVLCIDTGSELRMLSYGDVESSVEDLVRQAEAALADAEQAKDQAQNAASDAVSQGNVPIYSTLASIASLEIPAGINAIRVNGRNAVGDGQGGLYVASDNGSTDTGMSGDGRTWWRVKDISMSRFDAGVQFTNEGFRQSLSPSFLQNNVGLSGSFAIKLEKPPFASSASGFQGFTFVTETATFYSAWNRSDVGSGERVIICRHDRNGSLIDHSSVIEGLFGHGQDLDHLYIDGVLYLVTDNLGSRGCTFFIPSSGQDWVPDIKRQFDLQPSSVKSGTVKLSLDKKFLLKSGGPTPDGGKNFRMFKVSDLLNGPDGDRDSDGTLFWEMKQPSWANAGQAWLSDGVYNYHINGTTDINSPNMLRVVRISDKQVVEEIELTTLKDVAALQNGGSGDRLEPEGAAWIISKSGGRPQMWAGFGMRSPTSSDVQMMVAPIFQRDFGAENANGNRSPFGIAMNLSGGGHKIAWPKNEALSFSNYENNLEGTKVDSVIAITARNSEPVKLRVVEENNGPQSDVLEINRNNGGVTFKAVPMQLGGSTPTIGLKTIYVDGNGRLVLSEKDTGGVHILFRSPTANVGSITSTATTTSYNTTSDAKFKESKGELSFEDAKRIIELIVIHNFTWIGDYSKGGDDIGAFAQELYEIYPRAVNVGGWFFEDGTKANEGEEGAIYKPWGIDYSKLIPVMMRALQGLLLSK